MDLVSFALDRRLYELLQEEGYSQFTTRELRDGFAKRLEGMDVYLGDVRRFVYEQIRRMVHTGWLVPDKVQRLTGQIYHLRPCPQNLKLELVDGVFEQSLEQAIKQGHATSVAEGLISLDQPLDLEQHLQSILKKVRLDFLSAMGETECYRQLVDDIPQLRDRVEDDYREARDRSSRLRGHLRAVEKTLKYFEASQ